MVHMRINKSEHWRSQKQNSVALQDKHKQTTNSGKKERKRRKKRGGEAQDHIGTHLVCRQEGLDGLAGLGPGRAAKSHERVECGLGKHILLGGEHGPSEEVADGTQVQHLLTDGNANTALVLRKAKWVVLCMHV